MKTIKPSKIHPADQNDKVSQLPIEADDPEPDHAEELPLEADELRGTDEIYAALNEFLDKVSYNRHQNLLYRIENGSTKVVPQHAAQGGGVLIGHETFAQAVLAA